MYFFSYFELLCQKWSKTKNEKWDKRNTRHQEGKHWLDLEFLKNSVTMCFCWQEFFKNSMFWFCVKNSNCGSSRELYYAELRIQFLFRQNSEFQSEVLKNSILLCKIQIQEWKSKQTTVVELSKYLREHSYMTSNVFWIFLITYLP